MLRLDILAITALLLAGCNERRDQPRAPYRPLVEAEVAYGRLITAGNHPTPDQNGTGERVGLFQDRNGTVWGLPMMLSPSGEIMACAPSSIHAGRLTDIFPAGSTVIGSTNRPTGWRGGTGDLELLLRDQRGRVHWQAVHGGELDAGSVCRTPESPGPPQQLQYYRLIPEGPDS